MKKHCEITNRKNPDILQIKTTRFSTVLMIHRATVCCSILSLQHFWSLRLYTTIFPIKILDYNRKHLHSTVTACICSNSTIRHCGIFKQLHYVFNSMSCNHRVDDRLCPMSAHLKIIGLLQNQEILF